MKKRLIIILAMIVVLITAVVVYLGFCVGYKTIYYRMYKEDRIKGEITVNIDGHSAQFDEARTREGWNCEGDFFVTDNTAKVSLKAGDYGPYDFSVYAVGLDQSLQLSVWQLNWWNVKTFRLDISVDTVEKIAHITCFTTNIDEEGNVYEDERTWNMELAEDLTIGFD
ncbi:MAG: hypothetical protein HFE65_07375 [Clostridiales bacterium]|nr:hypothetical protein [Clostridiales bacterium]